MSERTQVIVVTKDGKRHLYGPGMQPERLYAALVECVNGGRDVIVHEIDSGRHTRYTTADILSVE